MNTRSTPLLLAIAWLGPVGCSEPEVLVGGLGGSDTTGASSLAIGSSSGADATTTGAATTGGEGPAGSSDDAAEDTPKLDVGGTGSVEGSCVEGTDLVWLLFERQDGADPEVYWFDPASGAMEYAATIDCKPGFERHWSMSVDANGNIYTFAHDIDDPFAQINAGGELGSCILRSVTDAPPSFLYPRYPFDHAFVAPNPDDLASEQIYVHDWAGEDALGSFGRLEIVDDSVSIEVLADTSYDAARFAGTGDGRLFAIVFDDLEDIYAAPRLVELDVADGSVRTELAIWPNAHTLAFYAGDLVVFEFDGQGGYLAKRFDLDDDDDNGVHEIVEIVGPSGFPPDRDLFSAASPTCIPTTPAG